MRVRKKDEKNIFKVGVFITALTAVLMIMIASIGKENSIFDKKVDIRARVGSVSNLKPGSYIELKGIRIGTVSNIEIISEDEVQIDMTILEKELKWIKKDSKVSVSTAGLVGDKFVEIYGGTKESEVLNPEKDALVSEDLTDFKKIMVKGESIANTTNRILSKLDTILLNMEDGKSLVDTVNSLQKVSKNLEVITFEMKDAHVGQAVKNMSNASGSLNRILTQIEKGPGTMNSMIYDEGLHDDLRALLGGAQRNKVIKYFIRESIKNSERKE